MTDLLRPGGTPVVPGLRERARPACRLVTLLLATCAVGLAGGATRAQAAPQAAVGVDVTITHTRLAPDGQPAPSSDVLTAFRLERVLDESGWRTVLTYRPTSAQRRTRASDHPLDGARIEYADGAAGIRVVDKDGRVNARWSAEGAADHPLPVFDGVQRWLDTLVIDPQRRDERRNALARQYGRPEGRVRTFERYLSRHGDTEEEVLADPRSGLVMEARQTRRGVLEQQTTFDYQTLPDGRFARRTIRSESWVREPGQPSDRVVLTVAFSNLTSGGTR